VPAFANEFTVVRVDARGCGETRKPPVEYSSVEMCSPCLITWGSTKHTWSVSPWGARRPLSSQSPAPERVASLVAVSARTGMPVSPELRAGWDRVDEIFERATSRARTSTSCACGSMGRSARRR
jgi:pimeloyl-ACP methyl ester carboxylesterase